jgi:hypothetical protein
MCPRLGGELAVSNVSTHRGLLLRWGVRVRRFGPAWATSPRRRALRRLAHPGTGAGSARASEWRRRQRTACSARSCPPCSRHCWLSSFCASDRSAGCRRGRRCGLVTRLILWRTRGCAPSRACPLAGVTRCAMSHARNAGSPRSTTTVGPKRSRRKTPWRSTSCSTSISTRFRSTTTPYSSSGTPWSMRSKCSA